MEVRIGACIAASTYTQDQVGRMLKDLLYDEAWQVRAQAAKALGSLGDNSIIPILSSALVDKSFWVRQNAAASISALGPEGLKALGEVLSSGKDRFAVDAAAQELHRFELLQTPKRSRA
jgi:HEAT repeat protein